MASTVALYPQQWDFVTSQARRPAFIGGINSGKTLAGCVKALSEASVGQFGMMTAPTLDILRDAMLRSFYELARDKIADHNKNEKRVTLVNGAEFIYRTTSDPEALRGPNLSWVWMDEAALSPEEAFKICTGRARIGHSVVFPTTTPRGRNWLWRRWQDAPETGYDIFRASTYDNPKSDKEWLAGQERELTGQFARQELYGEFVAFEGLVYDEFNRDVHIWPVDVKLPEMVGYLAGVDWGYSNPAVILAIGYDSDGRFYAVDEYYQRRVQLAEHVSRAADMHAQYHFDSIWCDPSEPEHIAMMQEAGLPAYGADNAVIAGIQAIKARLAVQDDNWPRLYVTTGAPNLTAELESYQWAERRGERIDQPEKANDHAMDALRYAIFSADRRTLAIETSSNPFYE